MKENSRFRHGFLRDHASKSSQLPSICEPYQAIYHVRWKLVSGAFIFNFRISEYPINILYDPTDDSYPILRELAFGNGEQWLQLRQEYEFLFTYFLHNLIINNDL